MKPFIQALLLGCLLIAHTVQADFAPPSIQWSALTPDLQTVPTDGVIAIPADYNIFVSQAPPINEALAYVFFVVSDSSEQPVEGALSYDERAHMLIWKASAALASEAQYTAHVRFENERLGAEHGQGGPAALDVDFSFGVQTLAGLAGPVSAPNIAAEFLKEVVDQKTSTCDTTLYQPRLEITATHTDEASYAYYTWSVESSAGTCSPLSASSDTRYLTHCLFDQLSDRYCANIIITSRFNTSTALVEVCKAHEALLPHGPDDIFGCPTADLPWGCQAAPHRSRATSAAFWLMLGFLSLGLWKRRP